MNITHYNEPIAHKHGVKDSFDININILIRIKSNNKISTSSTHFFISKTHNTIDRGGKR